MRCLLSLLMVGCSWPTWGLPEPTLAGRFRTSPIQAGIYQEVSSPERPGRYLGRSDREIRLDARGSQVNLIFRAPGYQDYHLRIAPGYFYQHTWWPEQGRLEMTPTRWDTWVHAHSTGLLSLAVGSLLLWGLSLWRKATPPIGGYRLLRLLGQGGSARVYLAVPAGQGAGSREAVAVKVFKKPVGEHAPPAGHPGIVQTYHRGRSRGLDYAVMELLPGKTLRSLIRSGGMDRTTVVGWIRQILNALEFAHQHGALHADLKPENVLLAEDGTLKLTDFADCSQPPGTPAYFAPEQLLGRPVGVWTDQYGLGLLTFELLTGALPAGGVVRSVQPVAPGGLEKPVEAVLQRMLAIAPQDRFPSLHEAGQALLEAL